MIRKHYKIIFSKNVSQGGGELKLIKGIVL